MKRLTSFTVLLALLWSVGGAALADGGQVVSGRAVAEAAEAFVRAELAVPEAHSVRTVPERRMASGQITLSARWTSGRPAGDLSGRRVIVPVSVLVDGKVRQTIAVLVEVGASTKPDNAAAKATPQAAATRPASAPTAAATAAAPVVKRGERLNVTCRPSGGGIEIELEGRAMDSGAVGDTVRVQIDSSRRTVEARVVGPQKAEMSL